MEGIELEVNTEIRMYRINVAGHVDNIACARCIEDLRSRLLEPLFPTRGFLEGHLHSVVTVTRYRHQLGTGHRTEDSNWIAPIGRGVMHLKVIFRMAIIIVATGEQGGVLIGLQAGRWMPRRWKRTNEASCWDI